MEWIEQIAHVPQDDWGFHSLSMSAAPPSASHRPGSELWTVILGEGGGKRDGNSWLPSVHGVWDGWCGP